MFIGYRLGLRAPHASQGYQHKKINPDWPSSRAMARSPARSQCVCMSSLSAPLLWAIERKETKTNNRVTAVAADIRRLRSSVHDAGRILNVTSQGPALLFGGCARRRVLTLLLSRFPAEIWPRGPTGPGRPHLVHCARSSLAREASCFNKGRGRWAGPRGSGAWAAAPAAPAAMDGGSRGPWPRWSQAQRHSPRPEREGA